MITKDNKILKQNINNTMCQICKNKNMCESKTFMDLAIIVYKVEEENNSVIRYKCNRFKRGDDTDAIKKI